MHVVRCWKQAVVDAWLHLLLQEDCSRASAGNGGLVVLRGWGSQQAGMPVQAWFLCNAYPGSQTSHIFSRYNQLDLLQQQHHSLTDAHSGRQSCSCICSLDIPC